MRKLLVLVLALTSVVAMAQGVSLTVTKNGNDVVLNWTGGTGPYTVVKSRHPSMSIRTQLLGTPSGTTLTDTNGALAKSPVIYYIVSDSSAPTVTITSVTPDFVAHHPGLCVSGTSSSPSSTVSAVYCNSITANGTTSWATCWTGHYGVPVPVPFDTVIGGGRLFIQASCVDLFGNWGFSTLFGDFNGELGSKDPVRPRGVGR
jgi:hypothetical protein